MLPGVARVAILGPGAVGGLLAGALARAGREVVLIGREETAAAIARSGLHVQSPRFGDFHVQVPARDRLRPEDGPAPATLVVAVKAPMLEAALDRVTAEPAAVVPLLNGVEHVGMLRERFGDRVVAAVIRVQAHREDATHVVHRAPFVTVSLAEPGCEPLEDALRAAGVEVTRGGSEAAVLWGKLSRLCGLALATAAADAPLGEVRDDARAVSSEVVAVANAEGAGLDRDVLLAELDGLPDAASSSLRADVTAGAPDELDAIAGAVRRAAARHGVTVRHVERLSEAVERRRR